MLPSHGGYTVEDEAGFVRKFDEKEDWQRRVIQKVHSEEFRILVLGNFKSKIRLRVNF